MPVSVSPTEVRPTHHLALVKEDGTKIGIILCDAQGNRLKTAVARSNLQNAPLRTTSGESSYSDLELPFAVIAQDDWTGGAGQERFEQNKTKYLEGERVQTVFPGQVMPGPLEHFTKGYGLALNQRFANEFGAGDTRRFHRQGLFNGAGGIRNVAVRFTTPSVGYTARYIWAWVRTKITDGNTSATLTWALKSETAGDPGTTLASGAVVLTETSFRVGRWQKITIASTALTASTNYWIVFSETAASSTATRHVELGVHKASLFSDSKQSADGSTWSAYDAAIFHRITEEDAAAPLYGGWFFEYKLGWYFITSPDDGSAPKMYLNGWRGAADSNAGALTKLKDATQTGWAGNAAAQSVVIVIGGPGSEEEIPWRAVSSSISGELTVSPAWNIEHTTSTDYVVVGAKEWFEITGHGWTSRLTDEPLEVNGILYGCTGEGADMRRMREYNNVGVWTREFLADTGNKALFLITVDEKVSGTTIWRVRNLSTGVEASSAAPQPWGTNLTFSVAESVGRNTIARANNLIEFVDPSTDEPIPWVALWDELWGRREGKWRKLKQDELAALASEKTGRAMLVHDTHLYLTLGNGLEQLTDFVMLDLGPNRDQILTRSARQGEITGLAGYPGRFFAAVNGSTSSIQMHSGVGNWEEHYRKGPESVSRPIRALKVQSIPGAIVSRLWFLEGKDLMWLGLPRGTTNPTNDAEYCHAPETAITLSRMHANLYDRTKLWSSVKIISDLVTTIPDRNNWLDVDWQLDADLEAGFAQANTARINQAPSQEKNLTNYTADAVVAQRGKYLVAKIRLSLEDLVNPPVLRANLFETVIGLPVKFGWSTTILAEDDGVDLNGTPQDTLLAKTYLDNLDTLADGVQVFTLQSIAPTQHGKKVVISAPDQNPIGLATGESQEVGGKVQERYIATLRLIQVIL